ncbi:hypothetical protein MVEN_01997500 [Mycena venus]|uniref:Uncharacterized protein n=1 Tax=Mycena venus TaxID=2733690 RepID=A0A8H6XEQ3_9AGAR|nr:hypothetical protein MVEN_01997500 [Mycena venus]
MSAFPREVRPEIIEHPLTLLVTTWACAAAETFLYGAYLVMIALYVHFLRKRGLGQNRLLASATIVLFVLCTAHWVLVLAVIAKRSTLELGLIGSRGGSLSLDRTQRLGQTLGGLSLAANVVYVTANVLADAIFIFRCYAIWNFQIKIILFPILLTLDVAGIGYFDAFSAAVDDSKSGNGLLSFSIIFKPTVFDLSIGASLFTTFMLMGLTVGRIWMLARSARRIFGAQMASTYHTVCAMILESGAVYLCGGIAFIVLGLVAPFTLDVTTEGIVLAQLVGIAPTIIAVRVALGQSVENVNSFIVPMSRMDSSFHHEAVVTAEDSVDDEVLYIRPESVKVEAA